MAIDVIDDAAQIENESSRLGQGERSDLERAIGLEFTTTPSPVRTGTTS
jgi:hypothetical protein